MKTIVAAVALCLTCIYVAVEAMPEPVPVPGANIRLVRRGHDPLHSPSKNVKTFLKSLAAVQFPRPLAFKVNGTKPTDIWTEDVHGRLMGAIDMDGGLQETCEYFLGLTPTNNATGYIIDEHIIRHLTEDKSNDIVAATYDLIYHNLSTGKRVHQTQILWAHFTKDNLIDEYDLTVFGLGRWITEIGLNYSDPNIQLFIKQQTCALHNQFCTGANQQYSTTQECMNFLGSIRFGDLDWTHDNSATCRFYHVQMTPFRPEVHCPHAGPTGGDRCIDVPWTHFFDYYDTYSSDFVVNQSYIA